MNFVENFELDFKEKSNVMVLGGRAMQNFIGKSELKNINTWD